MRGYRTAMSGGLLSISSSVFCTAKYRGGVRKDGGVNKTEGVRIQAKATIPDSAFIGRRSRKGDETEEIGRGLFERSEFRSPRRRAKREAGIPDNQRATFLGYFFAAGKKLQNDVILTTARRKNLNR